MSLQIDRHAEGPIVALRFRGVIDESWEGKRAASHIRASIVLLDLAGVRRISSFGIREWVDFINALGAASETVILIECSAKVVHQLNMVASFAGEAWLYSFYAPYRCDYCDAERDKLLQIDRDAELIAAAAPPEAPCESCGEVEYFDEDPASYFSFAAAQEPFELPPEVASFLASKLSYTTAPATRRMRADKQVEGTTTYLRLTGDLDGSFPAETLADGLEGRVILELSGLGRVDPAGAAAWRRFIAAVIPATDAVLIAGAAPMFVEKLTSAEDLGGAVAVSIGLPYLCNRCSTTTTREIDVAAHHAVLKFATPPEVMCPDCASPLACVASEELLAQLPRLPAPPADRDLARVIARFRARSGERPRRASTTPPPRRGGPSGLALGAGALAVAFVVAAALLIYNMSRDRDGDAAASDAARLTEAEAPAWTAGLEPLTGRCVVAADEGQPTTCAASSTLALSEQAAIEQAQLVAIDEMTFALGWGDADAASRRDRLLGRLADAGDWRSPRFRQLAEERVAASRAVAEALVRAGGGTLEPDLFVERWSDAGADRWRAFARLRLDGDEVAALGAAIRAGARSELGVEAVNFPPPLAWRHREVRAGALLQKVADGPLAEIGLRPGYVVTAIQGQTVDSAKKLVELLDAEVARLGSGGGQLRMVVHTGTGEPMTFVRDYKPPAPDRAGNGGGSQTTRPPTFNTWEEAGGSGDPRN